jgi:hypothetical protein
MFYRRVSGAVRILGMIAALCAAVAMRFAVRASAGCTLTGSCTVCWSSCVNGVNCYEYQCDNGSGGDGCGSCGYAMASPPDEKVFLAGLLAKDTAMSRALKSLR